MGRCRWSDDLGDGAAALAAVMARPGGPRRRPCGGLQPRRREYRQHTSVGGRTGTSRPCSQPLRGRPRGAARRPGRDGAGHLLARRHPVRPALRSPAAAWMAEPFSTPSELLELLRRPRRPLRQAATGTGAKTTLYLPRSVHPSGPVGEPLTLRNTQEPFTLRVKLL